MFAIDAGRDFTGNWILDFGRSSVRALGAEPESFLTLTQTETAIRCATDIDGAGATWSYRLDGSESRYKVGGQTRNSVLKWEGDALLINTLVSGAENYTIMERCGVAKPLTTDGYAAGRPSKRRSRGRTRLPTGRRGCLAGRLPTPGLPPHLASRVPLRHHLS